jgi:pimeloyl-ACP methyl ester carboxylesterase
MLPTLRAMRVQAHACPGAGLAEVADTGPLAAIKDRLSIAAEGLAASLLHPGQAKPPVVLVHGAIQGGWVWDYAQPNVGAPAGVKGLLEQAGYTVYNPTLPYHDPSAPWNITDGIVDSSLYVDTIVQVPCFIPSCPLLRSRQPGRMQRGPGRSGSPGCPCMLHVTAGWRRKESVHARAQIVHNNNLQDVTLVGHSLAGVWLQLVAQRIPDSIGRLLFLDAAILLPGESFSSNHIAGWQAAGSAPFPAQVSACHTCPLLCTPSRVICPSPRSLTAPWVAPCMHALPLKIILNLMHATCAQAFFSILFSYPFFSQQCSPDLYRNFLVNTRKDQDVFVQQTYSLLVPEPHGPECEVMDTTAFFTLSKPKAFLLGTQDITLSNDPSQWLLFSDRMRSANNGQYAYQVFNVSTDHEAMLTDPVGLASVILQAAAALGG